MSPGGVLGVGRGGKQQEHTQAADGFPLVMRSTFLTRYCRSLWHRCALWPVSPVSPQRPKVS